LVSYFLYTIGSKHVQTRVGLPNILQGSAVTQSMLCWLTIYPPVANFL